MYSSPCMYAWVPNAGPDVTLSSAPLYRRTDVLCMCWGHTYTNPHLQFPVYKRVNMGMGWVGVSWGFEKCRVESPQDILQRLLCSVAAATGCFWVLAAGRGAECQGEDKDKERLEEERRDHIYFHDHLYLITCSCFVLSLISSSPGWL